MGSKEKLNYPECVEEAANGVIRTLIDHASNRYWKNNTASMCASRCKELKNIFSGTKNELCICGNKFNTGISISKNCKMACPGNNEETCGGEASVSLRRPGYEKVTTMMPRPTRQKTSSEIPVTSLSSKIPVTSLSSEIPVTSLSSEIPVTSLSSKIHVTLSPTSQSTGNTASVFPSTEAMNIDGKEELQMTALYIALPVVGAVALIVCLILRYRRQKDEASVKRLTVSACSSKNEQDSKRTQQLENYNYWAQGVQVISQDTSADDMCDEVYSTISDSNDTLENDQDHDEIIYKPGNGTVYSRLQLKSGIPNSSPIDNTYSHIGSASKMCMNKTDNTYNTVQFSLRAENTGAPSLVHDDLNSVYDSANGIIYKPGKGTVYSRLQLKSGIPNSSPIDNTYSHIGSASKMCMNKTDNTYNTVQFSLRAENTGAPSFVHDDLNSVYDSANGRNKSRVNEMGEYAHIITVIASK